ncbi:MAG: polysaccharide pyruvyl transferase family protein [Bacteroides sp.]|nr:polysaccharide pyruvyl transferase family protein [Bacteroides sp.]
MKNKLLGVNTPHFINIGDYIQALASAQFYPSIDGFIQREGLKEYNDEDSKIIMNGWYMHNAAHWPPSKKIHPLFIAFHINISQREKMLSSESISYLKKYEPIGCRDINTRDMLLEQGVNAYFSGCMTLTLGYKYKSTSRNNKIYFADPYVFVSKKLSYYLPKIPFFLYKFRKIAKISKKWYGGLTLQGLIKSTLFLQTYSQLFDEDILINSEFVSQAGTKGWPDKDTELLKLAETLVTQYAQAPLVITSRIHCALPCLGLETPVLFTMAKDTSVFSGCRLGGLKELFNIIEWNDGKLIPKFPLKGKLSINNHPKNKRDWVPLAQNLIKRAKQFFEN